MGLAGERAPGRARRPGLTADTSEKVTWGAAPDQVVDQCPFEPVVDVVFGRWTSHVLWTLATARCRYDAEK